MTIRLATGDDVAALADLEREVFGGDAWDARALVAELEDLPAAVAPVA